MPKLGYIVRPKDLGTKQIPEAPPNERGIAEINRLYA